MKNKLIVGILIILSVISSLVFAEPTAELKDAMFTMSALGLVDDDMDLKNRSKKAITREEFAELVFNVYGYITSKNEYSFGRLHNFTDVSNPKVVALYKLGIVKGTSATTFSPDAKVTREQMATMIMRAADSLGIENKKAYQSAKAFKDQNNISKWANRGVLYCRVNGILKGGTGNYYYPKANATIGQVIIVQDRIYKLLDEKPYKVFTKNKVFNSYSVPAKSTSGLSYSSNNSIGIEIRYILGDFQSTENRDVYKQIFDLYGSLRERVNIYDIIEVVKYITSKWSKTDLSFEYDSERFVKNGVLTKKKPLSKPYIRLESAGFMYVEVIR